MTRTVCCPICGKSAEDTRLRPFCSARCADVDLGRWFTGAYRVPGEATTAERGEEAQGREPAAPTDRKRGGPAVKA